VSIIRRQINRTVGDDFIHQLFVWQVAWAENAVHPPHSLDPFLVRVGSGIILDYLLELANGFGIT
jgi:hypothetical protein